MTSRMSVSEAATRLPELIEQITRDRITVELEKDEQVVARLSPLPSLRACLGRI